ncbi:microtubule-associated protein futsch-like isoform X2 [Mercenaria mercenaria]|uniref:microtubule-associated protein futsch-like isoform X2 n=1 Tax=Mercenaria mercenaria TaxID=6596 RepID=UPI00234EA832|nr:microtubule-associated protein futsch-like isoform X2 [Mercenaria mercenaria]
MDNLNSEGGIDSQSGAVKGAALLLVIGEPFSEEHKKLILGEISKGFRCWDIDATGIDVNDELAQIANKADLGEEGPNGERVIRHSSEGLSTEILVNPQAQTVTIAVKNFLTTPTKHKHLIYSGHAFQGSGAWILQDDTFTFNNFAHVFRDQDIGNAVRQQQGSSLYIYTGSNGDWTNGHIAKNDFSKLLDVKLNPTDKLENLHGVLQFTAYISNFVRVRQLNELLQSSDVVGNIRFSRPTLYIFPGCQGDSALFGISGFNLLVNGGYSRKACFWDFTRHLDRIDAALMTHLGTDNLYGFGSVLQRKSIENVHPEIGFMYVNASDKIKSHPHTEASMPKEETLQVNLAEEGNKLIQYAKQIGPIPQSCSRTQSGQTIEPINLYHKVGIGSLDMYILNPITDSKEMKEFYQQWNQNVSHFGTNQHMSLPNTLSVCALLVWQPSNPNDNITRIFFPGNAPQHKVLEGLEKLKNLDILKHPQCSKASLTAKPAAKKPAGLSSRPPARSKISPVTTPKNEVAKKEVKEAPAPKPSTPRSKAAQTPSQKAKREKEDVNKKTMKAPEKVSKTEKPEKAVKAEKTEKLSKAGKPDKVNKLDKTDKVNKAEKIDKTNKAEKTDKPKKTSSPPKGSAKSSTSSTPTTSSTPKEAASPVKEPTLIGKQEEPAEMNAAPQASVPDILDTAPQAEPLMNGNQESSVDPPAFSSEPLQPVQAMTTEQPESLIDITPSSVPEPSQFSTEPTGALDREKMLELGIYDEDHDIEQDLNAQQPPDNSDKRLPQMFGGMADSMHEDLMDDMSAQNAMQGSFHGDLMSGSMHEAMFDNKRPYDGPFGQNGDTAIEEVTTPEDDTSEEIQPQALPEPVAYAPESYGQEPDVIPIVSAKEESQAISEPEVTPTSQEPDLLPVKQETEESHGYDEESTVPVEDKAGYPAMLETPDEVENTLPEDIQEKDLSEETEKEVIPTDEPFIEEKVHSEPDDREFEASEQAIKEETLVEPSEEVLPKDTVIADDVGAEPLQTTDPNEQVGKDLGLAETEFEEKPYAEEKEPELPLNENAGMEIGDKQIEGQKAFQLENNIMPDDREFEASEQVAKEEALYEPSEEVPPKESVIEDDVGAESFQTTEVKEQVDRDIGLAETEFEEKPNAEEKEPELPLVEDSGLEDGNKLIESQKALELETDIMPNAAQKDELLVDTSERFEDRSAPEFSPEPELTAQDIEPELETVQRDTPEVPDVIERPISPEPDQLEQEKVIKEPMEEESLISQPLESENKLEKRNDACIENDFASLEDNHHHSEQGDEYEKGEAPESEEERAESPDSQLGAQDINRDSLERDNVKEPSPFSSDDQRDSIEREVEEPATEGIEETQRDSIERSLSPAEQEKTEKQFASATENEQKASVERSLSPNEEAEQRQSMERSASPEQRESTEKSFEDESDDSEEDDDDDEESSSFEQEEVTDEKCLIQDSVSDNQGVKGDEGKIIETDSLAAPTDSLADQQSDNLLTTESDYTDASYGGQIGYHEIDEQEGDSVEGIDEKDAFASAPVQKTNPFGDGFEQFGTPSFGSGPMSNRFETTEQPGTNPFTSYEKAYEDESSSPDNDVGPSGGPAGFNPLSEWGEPMGLPSPAPPEEKNEATKKGAKKASSDTKKPDSKRPTSATKKPAPKPATSNGVPDKSKNRLSLGGATGNASRLSMGSKTAPKPRPATAPASSESKSRVNGTKRPATSTGLRASPAAVKMPPLPPFHPFNVDLTYIPNHGNSSYSDVEFFKRVRARYYVLSALSPNTHILDALLEGKKTWEDKSLAVTVIPTYDNETLRLWMTLHKEKLAEEKVEIAPSASRCTIQLQDHETSSSAYRLEF